MNYQPIKLTIDRKGDGYQVQLDSQSGTGVHTFDLPFTEQELELFILKVGPTRRSVRRINSPQRKLVEEFGQKLFDAVFGGSVYGRYNSALDLAQRRGEGLRIAIETQDAPELNNLPWEFLYEQEIDRFLSLSKSTPIVRLLNIPQQVLPLATSRPLRVLGMVSNPRGVVELDVEREKQQLEEALARRIDRGDLQVDWLPAATLTDLRHALRRNTYHIFHFTGHGIYDDKEEEGALLLEDRKGDPRQVSASVLGALLRDHTTLRLAVLNACEGARTSINDPFGGVAPALVRTGLPAVVAMQFEVTDNAAITFAREFYGGIAAGMPVYSALTEARLAILSTENDMEWGTPVLFSRVHDGIIFHLPEPENNQEESSAEHYNRIVDLVRERAWQEALDEWAILRRTEPGFPDTAQAAALATRMVEAGQRYERMDRLVATRQWQQALETWQSIRDLDSAYSDSLGLVTSAQQGLDAEEKAQARKRHIRRMYDEVVGLAAIEEWQKAKKKWDDLRKLDAGFPDSRGIMAQVEKGLYEEQRADESNRQKKKSGGRGCLRWIGISSIALVLIVAAIVVYSVWSTITPGAVSPTPVSTAISTAPTPSPAPLPTQDELVSPPPLEAVEKGSGEPFTMETPIATLIPAIIPPLDNTGTTAYSASDFFPTTLGSYWNYTGASCDRSISASASITSRQFDNGFETVSRVNSETDGIVNYTNGSWLQWNQGTLYNLQDVYPNGQTFSYLPPKPLFFADLTPGTTWSWQETGTGGAANSFFEVMGPQLVEWSGMEFESVIVRETFPGSWCGVPGTVTVDTRLAKGVGVMEVNAYLNGDLRTQLSLTGYNVSP